MLLVNGKLLEIIYENTPTRNLVYFIFNLSENIQFNNECMSTTGTIISSSTKKTLVNRLSKTDIFCPRTTDTKTYPNIDILTVTTDT